MVKVIEEEGRTVEEALEKALLQLNVPREKVTIEVLEEGSKGLFGVMGGKMARIRVKVINSAAEKAQQVLKDILRAMVIEAEVEAREEEGQVFLDMKGERNGLLIGKRGQTLNALQYIVNRIVNKNEKEKVRITLDSEGYRERRRRTLVNLAKRLANKVKTTGQEVVVEPMNPYDRRIIHLALQNDEEIRTFSRGEGQYRKVIIARKKSDNT